jgi:hypothetical protein
MNNPPRNKQGRPGEPSLWANKPADDALPPLEDALREDEPSLGVDEHTDDVHSLLEENARLRGFWFSYRTSSAETSFTQGNAVSWQNQSDLRSARTAR